MTVEETIGLSRRADRARAALQVEIETGRFAEAERLPGERDLARELSVSRTTLRRVIRALIATGLLYQRHGFGTYVHRSSPPDRRGGRKTVHETPALTAAPSWRQADLAYFPGTLSYRDTEERVAPASPAESLIFNLNPHEDLWQSSRVVLADERPVAIDETLVPVRYRGQPPFGPGADDPDIEGEGHEALRARQRIRSKVLTKKDEDRLDLVEKTIGIIVERYIVDTSGCCRALRRLTCEAGSFDSLQEITPFAPA